MGHLRTVVSNVILIWTNSGTRIKAKHSPSSLCYALTQNHTGKAESSLWVPHSIKLSIMKDDKLFPLPRGSGTGGIEESQRGHRLVAFSPPRVSQTCTTVENLNARGTRAWMFAVSIRPLLIMS